MTDAQREYERKRAQKAGMSLDKWLGQKQKQAVADAPKVAKPVRKKACCPACWTARTSR